MEWLDAEMKELNSNWSAYNADDRAKFIKKVKNSDAFYQRLLANDTKLEREFGENWFKADDAPKRIRERYDLLNTEGKRNIHAAKGPARLRKALSGAPRESRLGQLFVALGIFAAVERVAIAKDIGNHTGPQQSAWIQLQVATTGCLDHILTNRSIPSRMALDNYAKQFLEYMRVMGATPGEVGYVQGLFTVYIQTSPAP